MMAVYVATSASATGFIFQVSQLSGDPFVKFLFYALLRVWIPFVLYFADKKIPKFGRRQMLLIPLTVVFSSYLLVSVSTLIEQNDKIIFYGTLIGAVISNCLWIAVGQYIIELFPTVVRNTVASVSSLCAAIVGILMPQLIYAEKNWPALPFVFVSMVTGFSLLLTYFLLPETKGRPLPDTLQDIDNMPFAFSSSDLCLKKNSKKLKESCKCAEEGALIDNIKSI